VSLSGIQPPLTSYFNPLTVWVFWDSGSMWWFSSLSSWLLQAVSSDSLSQKNKTSYNVSNKSYLNSLPPPFSFISPALHSWNSFNRHFYIYIHVYRFCTVFTLLPPFTTTFLLPLVLILPWAGSVPPSCSLIL
jgi:hypothetical protein